MRCSGVTWWLLSDAFLLAAVASYGLVEAVRRWVVRRSVLDIPNDRSSHINPTPRGGGLAFPGMRETGDLR